MVEPAAKRLCEAAGTAVKKIAIEGNIGEELAFFSTIDDVLPILSLVVKIYYSGNGNS